MANVLLGAERRKRISAADVNLAMRLVECLLIVVTPINMGLGLQREHWWCLGFGMQRLRQGYGPSGVDPHLP
jgi:hypothetical protein